MRPLMQGQNQDKDEGQKPWGTGFGTALEPLHVDPDTKMVSIRQEHLEVSVRMKLKACLQVFCSVYIEHCSTEGLHCSPDGI